MNRADTLYEVKEMDVMNCTKCGKLFVRQSGGLCADCVRLDHLDFEKVRDFLRERRNVKTSPKDVETTIGVKADTVIRYIREGRLLVSEISKIEIECDSCGKPSSDGTICRDCRDEMRRELAKAMTNSSSGTSKPSTYRT